MTPIGLLEKMASTMRPRGTPSMRNHSVLWQKTSRMIGHPTWTKFGDKRARLSTSNALQPEQHAHKDMMEFGTITSSLGLEGWLTSISLSASAPGCLHFVYLRSICFQSSFSSRTGKIRASKLSKSKLASISCSKEQSSRPLCSSVLAQESTKLTKCHQPIFQCWNMIERFSSLRLL